MSTASPTTSFTVILKDYYVPDHAAYVLTFGRKIGIAPEKARLVFDHLTVSRTTPGLIPEIFQVDAESFATVYVGDDEATNTRITELCRIVGFTFLWSFTPKCDRHNTLQVFDATTAVHLWQAAADYRSTLYGYVQVHAHRILTDAEMQKQKPTRTKASPLASILWRDAWTAKQAATGFYRFQVMDANACTLDIGNLIPSNFQPHERVPIQGVDCSGVHDDISNTQRRKTFLAELPTLFGFSVNHVHRGNTDAEIQHFHQTKLQAQPFPSLANTAHRSVSSDPQWHSPTSLSTSSG